MSKEMKSIMESWRRSINGEENKIYESLLEEFTTELKTLTEGKAELNEVLGSIGAHAKKAYKTFKGWKDSKIKSVLTKAIDSGISLIDKKVGKASPELANKLKTAFYLLKKSDNMAIAVSIVSILVGLITGNLLEYITPILEILENAPDIADALKWMIKQKEKIDIGRASFKSTKLGSKISSDVAKLT